MSYPATPELALPPAAVEELLQTFSKALRARQLYLPNNPVYLKAIDNLRDAFRPIWDASDDLVLDIGDTDIRWEGSVVYSQATRSESIAWLLFKDGVRTLTFLTGAERTEIIGLLDVLQRARTLQPDDNDDLLTLLWERDFQTIRYTFTELLVDSGTVSFPESGDIHPAPVDPGQVTRRVAEDAPPRVATARAEDFDTSVYFLADDEVEFLREEIKREYTQDLRVNVLAMLFDLLESQPYSTVRAEILTIIESFVPYLLSAGDFRSVAMVLREARTVLGRVGDLLPEHRRALEGLPHRLSDEAALGQLLAALDAARLPPTREDLAELFREQQVSALPTLLAWFTRITAPLVKEIVEESMHRLATAHPPQLVEAIQSPDPVVAAEAIRLVARFQLQQAVAALGHTIGHIEPALRLAAVHALATIGTPHALSALERAVEDDDREVRLAAVRAFTQRGHRGALGRIEAAVQGRLGRESDLTERMALFEAYGTLAGAQAVPVLDGMLHAKAFMRFKEDPETRACAAMALGRVATAEARSSLERAAADKEPLVKNAVSRALRQRPA